ncbi:MAG: carbohydrate porin [Verrucomicrobiota bacterium]
MEGLTFLSCWRYRASENPGFAAGTSGPSSLFNPSNITGGLDLRIMTQLFEYTTPNKDFTLNAGWENPYEQFLQQPLSKLFENNAITSAKGIGGQAGPGIAVINKDIASSGGSAGIGTPLKGGVRFYPTSPVPWTSSYAAWGATLKIKPTKDFYIQSGLYESIAGATGVNPTQFTATSVYPYTSVPQSYLGQMKRSGEVTPVLGGDGKLIAGAMQNLGWVAAYYNNHGWNFRGAPRFTPSAYVAVKPTSASGGTLYGTVNGAATYLNSKGEDVTSPALYAASPYDQGGMGGGYAHNGLYNVNEIGWTPKFGPDKLEGKYAIGGYIWGQPNTNYTPTRYTVSVFNPTTGKVAYTSYGATKANPYVEKQVVWGLYLQADQQLYRVQETGTANTKSKELSERGLYTFNEVTFTPPQNNALPVYFQTGLVFKGLFAVRPKDCVGIALGAGFYSSDFNDYTQSQNRQFQNAVGSAYNATIPDGPSQQGTVNPQTGVTTNGQKSSSPLNNYYAYLPNYTSTEVIEAFYKVQVNQWMYVKPNVQFIINPAGNGTLGNDTVVGFTASVTF